MAVDSVTSCPQAKALQFIEDLTRDIDSVQKRVLSEILSLNSDTEYLTRFDLGGSTDRAAFKSKVPVVSYDDLLPNIERIANGDKSNILCSHPISEFFPSSGTSSGERKLIPTIPEEMERRSLLWKLAMCVVNNHVPGLDKGKGLYFMFTKAETKTPGGLVTQHVSSSAFKSEQYKGYSAANLHTSPIEAILCLDNFQSMYTQMLCGLLMHRDVTRIGTGFASGLLRAVCFLQLNWHELTSDIAAGTLNPRVTDPAIRARMAEILNPDPALAEFLSAECRDRNWEGIITRIWPNTKYLHTIITGAMAQYIPMLDYYSNGLPKVNSVYISSECPFGLNLKPMCDPYEVSYTIMPNMAYFEFIPHSGDEDSESDAIARVVELANVEIGKDYEIVVTTYAGLCRYRVDDILRVTGFHNKAPQFHFVQRKNVLLSIDLDKTDEAELHAAIQDASVLLKEFGTSVAEYTSCVDTKEIPGHYVIYWELLIRDPMRPPSHEVLEKCCLEMEESLSSVYRQYRAAERKIGPLEIRVLKNGTFEELTDYAISRGASISQYKVLRCVNSETILQLLDARVVSAHFSPAAPRWSP